MFAFLKFNHDDRGSVGIVFALVSTVVFGIIGGAIDFGRALNARASLQASVDASAIDGARTLALQSGDANASATRLFNLNISTSSLGNGTASTTAATIVPTIATEGNKMTVTATASVPTTLLSIMGITELSMTATATAEAVLEEKEDGDATSGDACILLKDPSKSSSLLVNGSVYFDAPGCEVHVRSNREDQAVMINSNVHFNVKRVCMEGNARVIGGGQGVVGPLEAHCSTANDPFAGVLPVPLIANCTANGKGSTGTRTNVGNTAYMTPGTFCSDETFNGKIKNIQLAPGTYVLKNSRWAFNSTMRGTGVTFYFADSGSFFDINGQGSLEITAPLVGPYNGILMYEPYNLSTLTEAKVNGGTNAAIEYLIYLPSRDMQWNGNSGVNTDKLTMVFNSLILN